MYIATHGQVLLHMAAFPAARPANAPQNTWFHPLQHYWSAYDTFNNMLIDTYVSDADLGPQSELPKTMLVGYEPHNFYFLESERRPGGQLVYSLLHAKP